VNTTSERSETTRTDPRLLLFPLALGIALMATNRWFTEVDDECAIIDLAAPPVSRTLRLYFSGAGLHEHPPLYDILLHGWLRLTGGNIHLLRLPSVIFYVFGAWIIGIVARRMGGERSQLWALVLVALWPFGFHFGRLATWYSFCFLLVSLLTLAYFRFVEEPGGKNWLWVVLASLALVYSNYFGWAILFCLAFDYLIRNRRQWPAVAPRLAVTAAILLAAYLPLFRAFHRETQLGIRPGAFSLATAVNVAYNIYCAFVSESVAPWFWFLGAPACIAIAICLLLTLWRTPPAAKALLLYFLSLVTLLAALSAVVPKRVLLVSPWLILPVALALGSASNPSGRRALAGALVLVAGIGWFGILSRRFYAAPHWVEPWESIAGRAADVIHAGGVVIGSNPSFFFYLSYLLPTQSIASGASGAGGFAGLLPDSVRSAGVYTARQWAEAGHPAGTTTLLVKGLHYSRSADLTEEPEHWLDAHCSATNEEKLVRDPGAELKERYTRIPQPEWRIEIRTYACP
jgi:hypothetical protein